MMRSYSKWEIRPQSQIGKTIHPPIIAMVNDNFAEQVHSSKKIKSIAVLAVNHGIIQDVRLVGKKKLQQCIKMAYRCEGKQHEG